MCPDGTTPTDFTRRKFTLPERLDDQLQTLAAQHYQGNVSQCIRAAIEEHSSTLTDNDSLSLHQLERHVETLASEVESLDVAPADTDEESSPVHPVHDGVDAATTEAQQHVTGLVLAEFKKTGMSFRLADIIERLDAPPEQLVRAFGRLVDLGYIIETAKTDRYRITALGRNG